MKKEEFKSKVRSYIEAISDEIVKYKVLNDGANCLITGLATIKTDTFLYRDSDFLIEFVAESRDSNLRVYPAAFNKAYPIERAFGWIAGSLKYFYASEDCKCIIIEEDKYISITFNTDLGTSTQPRWR